LNQTNLLINNSMNRVHGDSPPSILECRIISVNPLTLTVSVFVTESATRYDNVSICFPAKGINYGTCFMPRVGSKCLLLLTSKGKTYLVGSLAMPPLDENSFIISEKLVEGENSIQSSGFSYLRQDSLGNNILSSSSNNCIFLRKDGVNGFYSTGDEKLTVNSRVINGFKIGDNIKSIKNLKESEIKVLSHSEYYSKINIPRAYDISEIISIDGSNLTINEEIRLDILNKAKELSNKINDYFDNKILEFRNKINNLELTDEELSNAISEVLSDIKADFNITKKGVKIIIEKGNAINKNIENINDISNLSSDDFVKSSQDKDIALRLQIKDIETDTIKASASIDVDGNCSLNFKTLNIEVDTGGYNVSYRG